MNKKHLKIDELTSYFLNNLTRDNETSVQEHLRSCAECRKELENVRSLRKSIFQAEDSDSSVISKRGPFRKILSSNWIRYAAAAVVILGIGIGYYSSYDNGFSTVNEGIVPETVLSLDSLSTEDTIEYYCPDEKLDSTGTECADKVKCD